jgi:hypothetical protein
MHKAIQRNLLLVLVVVGILAGCSSDRIGDIVATTDQLKGVLKLDPDPPVPMEPVKLSLTLTDLDGNPINGALVAYDLTMPGMSMPPNTPQTSNLGSGLYNATVILTMAGDWQLDAAVTIDGRETPLIFSFSTK